MADTRISDLIVPQIFQPAVLERAYTSSVLMESGVATRNPALEAGLAGGGLSFSAGMIMPVVDQPGYAANVPTDVFNDLATPKKVTTGASIARRIERNDHFAHTDLTVEVTGVDLTNLLVGQAASMVTRWRQNSLIATINGAINETNTPGLINASGAAFSLGAMMDTFTVFGDGGGDLTGYGIAMNARTLAARRAAEVNAFIPASQTNVNFATYLGMPILISDSIPNGEMWFFRPGGVSYGVLPVKNAVEVQRETLSGNGGGGEIVGFRDAFTFAIQGMSFTGTTAGFIPTDAELANPANWTQVGSDRGLGVAKFTFTV